MFENFSWGVLFLGVGQVFLVYTIYKLQVCKSVLLGDIVLLNFNLSITNRKLENINVRLWKLESGQK